MCSLLAGVSFAQESFQQCTAAFLNKNMVVNEYSPSGKCVLTTTAVGELTVRTVELSPMTTEALRAIPFKIAVRDAQTNTLTMYAHGDFIKVDVQQVLTKCKKGDSIVLLTLNDHYSLPHNEILIQ